MKFTFAGITRTSMAVAYTLKKLIKNSENSDSEISGIYGHGIESTVNAAVALNVKAYLSFEELIADSDVIIISSNDDNLSYYMDTIKENRIQNKILCHLNQNTDSSAVCSGTTNTYASMYLPFTGNIKKPADISDTYIMIEGGGRKFDEFALFMTSLGPTFKICTKEERQLAILAKHFITDYMALAAETARRLYKFSGIYSQKSFTSLLKQNLKNISSQGTDVLAQNELKNINEGIIKKNMDLLKNIDYPDTRELYRSLETHLINECKHNSDKKEKMLAVLRKIR